MQNKLEKWRKLLLAAKPEEWKWEPPQMPPPQVKAKEPPTSLKGRLNELVSNLPDTEKAIVHLRFVDGFSQEQIAEMLGCKPLLIAVIERGAIERLTKALNADESILRSWLNWWGDEERRKVEASLPEPQFPSPKCLPLGRIYTASLRRDWREEEESHIRSCPHCRELVNKISKRLWHPSWGQLWQHVMAEKLSESERLDIRYHIEEDKCQRCSLAVMVISQSIEIARAKAISRLGLYERKMVAEMLAEDVWERLWTLKEIAIARAKAGEFGQAVKEAEKIEDAKERSKALREIAIAIAEAGEFEQAVDVAEKIEDTKERSKALREIAKAMAEAWW